MRPSWLAHVALALIRVYQLILSPLFMFFGARCRFHPSCSAYALEVVRKDGAIKGSMRAAGRLLRCHPLHPGGFDPP